MLCNEVYVEPLSFDTIVAKKISDVQEQCRGDRTSASAIGS